MAAMPQLIKETPPESTYTKHDQLHDTTPQTKINQRLNRIVLKINSRRGGTINGRSK
ncbi:MAG TPA: hypothetical protein GXZ58_10840 [Bacilli bacterium]|nr:hypothetical protein [Bacilli bacterium]